MWTHFQVELRSGRREHINWIVELLNKVPLKFAFAFTHFS
jgi:hypothetical protein